LNRRTEKKIYGNRKERKGGVGKRVGKMNKRGVGK